MISVLIIHSSVSIKESCEKIFPEWNCSVFSSLYVLDPSTFSFFDVVLIQSMLYSYFLKLRICHFCLSCNSPRSIRINGNVVFYYSQCDCHILFVPDNADVDFWHDAVQAVV